MARSATGSGADGFPRRLAGVVALITSAANPRLKLVRKLQSRSQRRKLGLFVAEGEELLAEGLEAGLEPVDVLRAGEDVESELLAGVSELPRSSAGCRRLPDGGSSRARASSGRACPLAGGRPWERGRADPHCRCLRSVRRAFAWLCRSDLAESSARLGWCGVSGSAARLRCGSRPEDRSGRAWWSCGRRRRATGARDLCARRRARRSPAWDRGHVRSERLDSDTRHRRVFERRRRRRDRTLRVVASPGLLLLRRFGETG